MIVEGTAGGSYDHRWVMKDMRHMFLIQTGEFFRSPWLKVFTKTVRPTIGPISPGGTASE